MLIFFRRNPTLELSGFTNSQLTNSEGQVKTIIEFNLTINSVNTRLGATPYKVWRLLTRRTRNGRDGGATKINYEKLWIIIININMIAYVLVIAY